MQKFIEKYNGQMAGALSCFDRVLFKGYLPLGWPDAMEALLGRQGRLIKDFKAFVVEQSARFKAWADDLAEKHGRPHLFLRKRMKQGEARGADDPARRADRGAGLRAARRRDLPEFQGRSRRQAAEASGRDAEVSLLLLLFSGS